MADKTPSAGKPQTQPQTTEPQFLTTQQLIALCEQKGFTKDKTSPLFVLASICIDLSARVDHLEYLTRSAHKQSREVAKAAKGMSVAIGEVRAHILDAAGESTQGGEQPSVENTIADKTPFPAGVTPINAGGPIRVEEAPTAAALVEDPNAIPAPDTQSGPAMNAAPIPAAPIPTTPAPRPAQPVPSPNGKS